MPDACVQAAQEGDTYNPMAEIPTGGKQGKAERRLRREEQAAPTGTGQIVNSKDPLLTQLNDLGSAHGRRARSQFLAEGILLVQRALEDGQSIDCIVYTADLLRAPEGPPLLDRAREAGIRCYVGSEGLLGKVTTTRPVPDVMAAVSLRFQQAAQFPISPGTILLIAENINNPDNLGMILRTADAAGSSAVVVAGADPFHKNCVRAARGAVGRLPILECRNLPEYQRHLKSQGVAVVGTALGGEVELYRCPLRPPIAVIVGNEQAGIAPETLAECSLRIRIPMAAGQDSLNVGVAAGVVLYEIFRRRTAPES